MKSLHVLGICGSLRRHSTNLGLLRYAKEHAPSGLVKIQELIAEQLRALQAWSQTIRS